MIKAILFDFDGVLTIDKTGSTTICNYIADACRIPVEKVKMCYYPFNQQLLLGEKVHQEIWPAFCEAMRRQIDYGVLLDSFRSTRLDDRMIALVKELKENYRIGMVTDNKCDRIETILEHNRIEKYFDAIAISANLHVRKDGPAIFEHILKKLNVCASECVFIDNTEKNLIIPKQMGMATLFFHDEQRDYDLFKEELMKVIV